MTHLRLIEGGLGRSPDEEIDRIIDDEIEPLIELVRTAAEVGDLAAMRSYSLVLVRTVSQLLDDGPALGGDARRGT